MWFLLGAGAIELAALAGLAWGDPRFPLPGMGLFGVAVVGYLAGALLARDFPDNRASVWWILGAAVAMRVVLLPAELRLSDDIWRYLWDGSVGAAGINPYLFAPADASLEGLRTAWHTLINNPTVPTIYGPTAQFAFRLIQLLGGSVLSAKVVWVALDATTALLLVRYARASGRSVPLVALLYAWSPLLIVETAWSGHLEALGLVLIVGVLILARSGYAALTGVVLAAAAMTKFAPVAVAPVLFRRFGARSFRRDGGWAFLGGIGIAATLGFLPFVAAGPKLWTGLATYAEHWRFNTGAFAVVEGLFTNPLHARFFVGGVVGLVIVVAAWRRFDAERAFLWILGAGIALSPTVHPWYVLWLLPVAALRKSFAWLYLSCAVFLAYWGLDAFHATGTWPEPSSVRASIWLPFFGLLIVDGLRSGPGAEVDGAHSQPRVSAGEEEQEGE